VSRTAHLRPTTHRSEKLSEEPRNLDGFAAVAVATGEVSVLLPDADRVRLVAGDVVALGPGARCELRARTTPCEVLVLEADPSWTAAIMHLSTGTTLRTSPPTLAVFRAATAAARRVRQILREIAVPCPAGSDPNALRRARGVVEILALAMEADPSLHAPSAPSQAGAVTRAAFLKAVRSLDERDDLDELTLGVFAKTLGLSERQISRLFRLEIGMTFCTYTTRLRVDRARRLLEESMLPVIEVAAETGWSSLAHFNAVFRRHTGKTPTAYRRNPLAAHPDRVADQ